MAKKAGNQSQCPRSWRLPNLAFCRALRFGQSDDMVYCMNENADTCGYALRFGSGFFCHHPKRGEIVARTKAKADE
jgi:hypothetical protein